MSTNCGKNGKQISNLTRAQGRGLRSLKTRVKEGELVILPTDKTGKFAVMTRETYELAGKSHIGNDEEVGWDVIKKSQSEINGHVSMLIKTFRIGETWGQTDRVRESMLGEGLSVCPVGLLYKDHKNWKKESGKLPPTRHVAGGHVGLNLHLSEIVSDILEPLAENLVDGVEVISTEDLLALVEELNLSMKGWNSLSWWAGWEEDGYVVCDKCEGDTEVCGCQPSVDDEVHVIVEALLTMSWERIMSGSYEEVQSLQDVEPLIGWVDNSKVQLLPDRSKESQLQSQQEDGYTKEPTCDGPVMKSQLGLEPHEVQYLLDGKDTTEPTKEDSAMKSHSGGVENYLAQLLPSGSTEPSKVQSLQENSYEEPSSEDRHVKSQLGWGEKPKIRTTRGFMEKLRRNKWETEVGLVDNDLDRKITSTKSNLEDIQDFSCPMVIVGTDVVSLYPNLDITRVVHNIEEAILSSKMKWVDIDYLEGVRYVALNWSAAQCRESNLRRILPVRRKNKGSRPGLRGAGPRGSTRGDTEQWLFPDVVLTEQEKMLLIATIVRIATQAMFDKHFYEFGGRRYQQKGGGPIGLRGTCAVARVVLQLFDTKWRRKLEAMRITTWLLGRYMDDGRAFLPPIKPGWRVENDELVFCLRWAREDAALSAVERTKNVLADSLKNIESYLEFTTETGDDFEGGWLPTLDFSLRVNNDNQVDYKFYEKETSCKMALQSKSAMCENNKMQILSQEVVRRLYNTRDNQGATVREQILDSYAQKLRNGGYSVEQTQKIIVNGIKGMEGRKRRCLELGRKLRRTAKESRSSRYLKKLTAKSNWFKQTKGAAKHNTNYNNIGGEQKGGAHRRRDGNPKEQIPKKTVIFVEQTPRGELASKLKELMSRIAPVLGFGVKVVERAGSTLKSQFPLSTLWKGTKCGRLECITCEQRAELELPDCTKSSAVYENVCRSCIKGAGSNKVLENVDTTVPAIYVGETSRTILERAKEHWQAWRSRKNESHIRKHQELCHEGAGEPDFVMRAVSFYRSALSRQVAEAVRIMRRGREGAVLNS